MSDTVDALTILHERVTRWEQAHLGFSLPNPFAGMSKAETLEFNQMKQDLTRMMPDLKGLMDWKPAISIDIVFLYAGFAELRKKLALPPQAPAPPPPPAPSYAPPPAPPDAPSAPPYPGAPTAPAAQKLKKRAIP